MLYIGKNMNNIILSIKDFFTFKFLLFSLAPLIVSSILFFGFFSYILSELSNIALDENDFHFFLSVYIIATINFLLYIFTTIFGGYLMIHLSIFFALFITSLLTPFIVSEINKKHYKYNKKDEVSFFATIIIMIKIFFKFIILFLLSSILLLVPIVNIIAPFIIFCVLFYLYYKILITDVASCVLNKDDFFKFNYTNFNYVIPVFIFYLLSHIPILGFILQVFIIIFITHLLFQKELKSECKLIDLKQ